MKQRFGDINDQTTMIMKTSSSWIQRTMGDKWKRSKHHHQERKRNQQRDSKSSLLLGVSGNWKHSVQNQSGRQKQSSCLRFATCCSSSRRVMPLLLLLGAFSTVGTLLVSLRNPGDCSSCRFLINNAYEYIVSKNDKVDTDGRIESCSFGNDQTLSSWRQEQQEEHNNSTSSTRNNSLPVMDIISIGSTSNTRRPFATVQQETFARHLAVRHYWRFTEQDDSSDSHCHAQLTRHDVMTIAAKCHDMTTNSNNSNNNNSTSGGKNGSPAQYLTKHFASPQFLQRRPPAWLCAQKRPIDALVRVVMTLYERHWQEQEQKESPHNDNNNNNNNTVLPDFLWILDDDSWLHVDNILSLLQSRQQQRQQHAAAQVVAGCLIRSQFDLHLSWYWGGFGVYLTRAAIERLMIPIQCPHHHGGDWDHVIHVPVTRTETIGKTNEFVLHACQQLDQNWIGELAVFEQNMTLVELMHAYSVQHSYLRHDEWQSGGGTAASTGAGYCMHSDTTLAYWFNFYHVADAPTSLADGDITRPEWMASRSKRKHARANQQAADDQEAVPSYDRLRAYNNTAVHKPRKWHGKIYRSSGECWHRTAENCTVQAHLCHYVSEKHMKGLFASIYQAHPENYLSEARQTSPLP